MEATRNPKEWLTAVQSGVAPDVCGELTDEETNEEALMMGLRLAEGVKAIELCDKVNKINYLSENPVLEARNGRLRLTPNGRPLLNAVLRELLA